MLTVSVTATATKRVRLLRRAANGSETVHEVPVGETVTLTVGDSAARADSGGAGHGDPDKPN